MKFILLVSLLVVDTYQVTKLIIDTDMVNDDIKILVQDYDKLLGIFYLMIKTNV